MKRKMGASLLYVMVVFALVLLVAASMLSLVVVSYRGRIAESNRIQNLYASDSGLDVACNITGKTIQGGVKDGFYHVSEIRCEKYHDFDDEYAAAYKNLLSDITQLEQKIEEYNKDIEIQKKEMSKKDASEETKKNCQKKIEDDNKNIKKCEAGITTDNHLKSPVLYEEFKRAFKMYLYTNGKLNFEGTTAQDMLKASILEKVYYDVSLKSEDYTLDDGEKVKRITEPQYKPYAVDFDKDCEIEVSRLEFNECKNKTVIKNDENSDEMHCKSVQFNKTHGEYYDLTLKSKFISKNASEKVTNSPRIVSASYKIKVPEYNDAVCGKSDININPSYKFKGKMRSFTVGKNMNIKNTDLDVNGDIFVQGESISNDDKVFGKYYGGINVSSAKVNFKAKDNNGTVNVSTRKTFNIGTNGHVTIGEDNGNLYAGNVYCGEIEKSSIYGHFINDAYLNVDSLITDNDLCLYATNTNVKMNNFYGINDKNTESKSGIFNLDDEKKIKKTSSSIIINGHQDKDGGGRSSVEINNEAYILGTAHINTKNSYKTGESIAVKGNYTAYAVPVSADEEFKYDKPLQLLNTDDVKKKAQHFSDYWNHKGNSGVNLNNDNADDGGITLPPLENVHSIGAIVCKPSAGSNTVVEYKPDSYDPKCEDKDGSGMGKVYEERYKYGKYVFSLDDGDNTDEYYKDIYDDGAEKADTVENLLKGLKNVKDVNDYDAEDEISKLNSDEDRDDMSPIIIFNDDENRNIEIKHNTKAVIVTNGDVTIDSDVDFKGNIICKGNLNVQNGGHCTLSYDENIIKNAVLNEPEVFHRVFGDSMKLDTSDGKESSDKNEVKQLLNAKIPIRKFLIKKIWCLIQ